MPKCKKSFCREEAVPYGKRYCPTHMHEYKEKQREFDRISATLRCCTFCGEKLTKTGHDRGDLMCRSCSEAKLLADAEAARREDVRLTRQRIREELESATNIEDLRSWIDRYVLGPA